MPASSHLSSALDAQLLRQLGARLKVARIAQGLTTSEAARRAGVSRMTLNAVEAGEPSPTMGSYIRVMSVLDVSKDLVLLANSEGESTDRGKPIVVQASDAKHEAQDLQSLVLHQEAVRLVKRHPDLLQQARETLERWRQSKPSHADHLWDEWAVILERRAWRRVLSHTQRSTELRQASPLVTVLPDETRRRILDEVKALKRGVRASGS